jgi:hypothetical protein
MDHHYYSGPQNLLDYQKKVVTDKLIRGREFTNQLQAMLITQSAAIKMEQPTLSHDDLIFNIIGSFDDALALLNSDHHPLVTDPACLKLEESGETRKSSSTSLKDRRGCYKRRKTSHTTTKLAVTLTDDGFAWRKYGQKSIHNTKHPRNYYRCTHKFDQDCQATKQVQRTEDEPPMYRTIYHGRHTCKEALHSPQIIFHPTDRDSSILLDFAAHNPAHSPEPRFLPLQMKQESKVVVTEVESAPQQDYLMSPDLTAFDSCGPMLSSGSDHGDVISSGMYSCTTSTRSNEMDPMSLGSGGFDDEDFQFDYFTLT